MPETTRPTYTWRGQISDAELFDLTASHGGNPQSGWWDRIHPHSLGWVTARGASGTLVGFTNVAWDGGVHAFLLDPKVRPSQQRRGIGSELVRLASDRAREAGCEWLHVDFEDAERLGRFYFVACGFRPTTAGLINLTEEPGAS
ncbi:MAG TPA: GNAT family N-acetyltransferase [Acidimicrobiales bacterium]|nr:GNAT family N-acetyltransferase [Acidimicrobiales bacterium]